MPSREITKAIEYLLHPDRFIGREDWDHDTAVETFNDLLRPDELTVVKDSQTHTVKLAPVHGEFVSSAIEEVTPERLITFSPNVFAVPNKALQDNLVSVMMPFSAEFNGTYNAIKRACLELSLDCVRADDIWDHSTFIQDVFDLIFCAKVVIVDFTGKNPNVLYETGMAHTLGKHVIPITQSIDDIPSDLRHHRALKYLPNTEGLEKLTEELKVRLRTLTS